MAAKINFEFTHEETKIVYLAVQLLTQIGINNGDVKPSVDTDSLRASLRNNIYDKTYHAYKSMQEMQEDYESNARRMSNGEWNLQ
jgi:hypothetical protein